MDVMFLHSTAQLKDGRLSRADSRKAAKELNRRKQREFEQKLAKEAKVIFEKLPVAVVNPPRVTNLAIIWENRRLVLANTRKRSFSTEVIRGNKRHSFEG
jgi:hypothetical protein